MKRHLAAAFACVTALGLTACGTTLVETGVTAETSPTATSAPRETHASAKPASRDAEPSCTRKPGAVVVSLTEYPHISQHIRAAIRSGQPAILHIDRAHADEHRGRSTDDLAPKRGYDRDEYPPAMSREGGESADVRYVKSRENRAAGASMGGQLRGYCNGQAFRLKAAKAPNKVAKPKPAVPAAPEPEADDTVSYANCDAVRAAGAAPLSTGDPGYAAHLDRDGDGVACEN